ncbi:MAG TPA: hypothetical protein VGB55_00365 [Tepidisphaeraceae bacterium]
MPRTLPVEIDWAKWLRGIERKRRSVSRQPGTALPAWFNRRATIASFHLEGLEASEADLDDAQVPPHGRRAFRSRPRQRLRNHLAILLSVERAAFKRESLKMEQVLRWYTVISSGLSTSELGLPNMMRIESIVRRINSPQMRLQPAIQEIAKLHCDLLNDPLFPSFNGILTRLLLQVHLTHCGLPPVLFEPHNNTLKQGDAALLLPRLLEMIDQTFDHLAASPSPEPA